MRLLALALSMLGVPAAAPVTVIPGPAVLAGDFPDPFLLRVDGGWLAFATNAENGANVQMAWSRDLARWDRVAGDALPLLPRWAARGLTWAPEVIRIDDRYVLYFTARERRSGLQCVGVATAKGPRGPYLSGAAGPIVCERDAGGSIDPSPFRDVDGTLYLLTKNDGNRPEYHLPTSISARRLTPDGLAVTGPAAVLLTNHERWHGGVVEAPTMVRAAGRYWLFYSASYYGWPADASASPYAMGVAACDGPIGPCRDRAEPLLASGVVHGVCLSGPGHQAVFEDRGAWRIAFHAWDERGCKRGRPVRRMHLGTLRFDQR